MQITTKTIEMEGFSIPVVSLDGELDGKTAPIAQTELLPLCQRGGKLILDMSKVTYMSSAGLRLMLLLYRQTTGSDTKMALIGLSEELKDTMSATGFLAYFTISETLDAGIAALK